MPEFSFISDLCAADKVSDKWDELSSIFTDDHPQAEVLNIQHNVCPAGYQVLLSLVIKWEPSKVQLLESKPE